MSITNDSEISLIKKKTDPIYRTLRLSNDRWFRNF